MAEKELRKMTRSELIEIIYALQQNELSLRAENKKLTDKLNERMLRMEEAGSIAEAALSVNRIYEDTQEAADQYLQSVQVTAGNPYTYAVNILTDAHSKADAIIAEAEERARKICSGEEDAPDGSQGQDSKEDVQQAPRRRRRRKTTVGSVQDSGSGSDS